MIDSLRGNDGRPAIRRRRRVFPTCWENPNAPRKQRPRRPRSVDPGPVGSPGERPAPAPLARPAAVDRGARHRGCRSRSTREPRSAAASRGASGVPRETVDRQSGAAISGGRKPISSRPIYWDFPNDPPGRRHSPAGGFAPPARAPFGKPLVHSGGRLKRYISTYCFKMLFARRAPSLRPRCPSRFLPVARGSPKLASVLPLPPRPKKNRLSPGRRPAPGFSSENRRRDRRITVSVAVGRVTFRERLPIRRDEDWQNGKNVICVRQARLS